MSAPTTDRLPPGIHFRPGDRPPPCFRLQLLDVAPHTRPNALHDALERVAATTAAAAGVTATLGLGRRLFDDRYHDPSLTTAERPPFLAYLDQAGDAFPATPWHRDPPANRGEADLAVQLTGPNDAAVDTTLVALWERIEDDDLPLRPTATFDGFGRPDGRGWLGFHDGVSNLDARDRRTAIEAIGAPAWMAGGTYMAFLRFRIDLARWRALSEQQQELLVGRKKATGRPLGADVPPDTTTAGAFADPPETTDPVLELSHVHRANQSRASPEASGALRIFRQGYDFFEGLSSDGPAVGLNFVSFQSDLATLQHLLHLPGWLGDVNFGGPPGSPSFITLADGGFYAVPPAPVPGAGLFRPAIERNA